MIYSIIRSKGVFYQLANLPEDSYQLARPRVQPKQLSQQRKEEGGVSSESGTTAKEEHTPQEGTGISGCKAERRRGREREREGEREGGKEEERKREREKKRRRERSLFFSH